ncbi:alpha/beta hydrolase [Pseudemcibacter aquimaris]|uniref:alpha/beta hydrolase n=1 Tax=Pseudemcibacter aquimaris TaxID=2857064 RepID=UPI002011D143|nr:alpha/beta fold hydrolase [Pseudemcibacter aquimaris]MCC3862086.1 alpha/beta fold hydrolase [Pseudemcibacter aquimaris]WDU58839.1 alpha/beta fold hydrolase [Pseudemcibacter aquimaris]
MSELPELNGPRLEPEGGNPEKLVILCHGFGSNGDDLYGLIPHLKQALPNAVYISPNAPEICYGAPNGYQWFPLSTLSREERLVGTLKAAPTLDHFIDQELEKYGLENKDLVLVGFSQGTMMSLHVGLRRKSDIAGIIGFSGVMTLPENWQEEITSKPPVALIHGDMDNVVPVGMMHEAASSLKEVDVDVTSHVSPGVMHSIGPDGLQVALDFLAKL